MSMARPALRSALHSSADQRVSAVLARAARSLYDDLTRLSMFVTVFMGCYEADARRVRFSSAGHAGMIYRPAGGVAILLDATDAPIGMLAATTGSEHDLRFGPGDLLLIASDGYYEARNPAGELYGFDRMMQDVDDSADRPLADIWAYLHDNVGRFRAAAPQDDDQTLLIMRGTSL
jgi:sigma-B regulation protein RsbU (phosphoserine phosphatase)